MVLQLIQFYNILILSFLQREVGGVRKKTYAFDQATIDILEELKRELGKKETQLLKEALNIYYKKVKHEENISSQVESFLSNVKDLATMIMELSYRLGKCEEKMRQLEELLKGGVEDKPGKTGGRG